MNGVHAFDGLPSKEFLSVVRDLHPFGESHLME